MKKVFKNQLYLESLIAYMSVFVIVCFMSVIPFFERDAILLQSLPFQITINGFLMLCAGLCVLCRNREVIQGCEAFKQWLVYICISMVLLDSFFVTMALFGRYTTPQYVLAIGYSLLNIVKVFIGIVGIGRLAIYSGNKHTALSWVIIGILFISVSHVSVIENSIIQWSLFCLYYVISCFLDRKQREV